VEDALPKKSEYRKFRVREVPGNDDFAAMEEVLTRRLTALMAERERAIDVSRRPRRFAYPPNLLLVDGGRGQLNVAVRVVEELGLEGEVSVAALAKRVEEVFVPGRADPIRIPRQSEALYLRQRIPDEAHPAGAVDVLDVGTGEGQVARLAVARGARRVVGVDPTWAQLGAARDRAGGPSYVRGVAAALPFPDAAFDTVVACLVFEHIEAVDEAVAEVGRVLRPGGRFLLFMNHPLLQAPGSGWIDDQVLEEQYWRIGPYLV